MVAATVLFFGRLADSFGRERALELPAEGCTVGAFRALAAHALAADDGVLDDPSIKVCLDREVVRDDAMVRLGQEIAFLPPLSGG